MSSPSNSIAPTPIKPEALPDPISNRTHTNQAIPTPVADPTATVTYNANTISAPQAQPHLAPVAPSRVSASVPALVQSNQSTVAARPTNASVFNQHHQQPKVEINSSSVSPLVGSPQQQSNHNGGTTHYQHRPSAPASKATIPNRNQTHSLSATSTPAATTVSTVNVNNATVVQSHLSAPSSNTATFTHTTNNHTVTSTGASIKTPLNTNHINIQSTLKPLPQSQPSPKQSKKKKSAAAVIMATTQNATPAITQGENTGRWTAEEHRLFLQGLEQHGKGWKKIASLIKSRTVVQIRTHAQKYFQKLAKARQNGEEGEINMENKERSATSMTKRRKSGTKRKAIASVVASAEREGKRRAAAAAVSDVTSSSGTGAAGQMSSSSSFQSVTLPAIAPALSHFVYPLGMPPPPSMCKPGSSGSTTPATPYQSASTNNATNNTHNNQHLGGTGVPSGVSVPSITTSHGTISGAALEDTLFRFLSPAPNELVSSDGTNTPPTQVNDIARQVGANPITLPSSYMDKNKMNNFSQAGGDVSPTGVENFLSFPTNWAWQSEAPAWYTKGADVDELLSEAEALDWLADSGDLTEDYQPPVEETIPKQHNNGSQMSEPSLLSLAAGDNVNPLMDNFSMEKHNNINYEHLHHGNSHEMMSSHASAPTATNLESNVISSGSSHLINGISPTPSAMNIPPLPSSLPSFFESTSELSAMKKTSKLDSMNNLSSASLFASASEAADAVASNEQFLLDAPFDDQAFVTALLD
mmetsp:Transcript_2762/g.3108  ORF Transcript_2762/g.3108 Transcript_2762/m.3108 type:complete len:755 (-) Transcript_2762:128-2392(-)